jgi:hypothetical protein
MEGTILMQNRLKLTQRVGMTMIGLAATALVVGTPAASAQMSTETRGAPPGGAIGMPGGGSFQVGGGYGESDLNTVVEEGGGPGLVTSGGYGPPMGPVCTVGVGGGPGYSVRSNDACGIGGKFGGPKGGQVTTRYP